MTLKSLIKIYNRSKLSRRYELINTAIRRKKIKKILKTKNMNKTT